MNRRYFGTDGIRGAYGASILTDEFAYRLGYAIGRWVADDGERPLIVIGRDTRASGPALRNAFAQGLLSAGEARVIDLGVLPTPAIAVYVRTIRATLGVVITASHNPSKDNGIKFFNSKGLKLSDDQELEIEALIDGHGETDTSTEFELEPVSEAISGYLDLLQPVLPAGALNGFKIVVDTANGAAFETTPGLLRSLGAEVFLYGSEPDGVNINDGVGSQFPDHLREQVLKHRAHLGIAHDGDADRVLFCDEKGGIVDGDVLLCMLALQELKHGRLNHNTLVATKQSNMGLDQAIKQAGGQVVRTSIGDRYVLEEMLKSSYNVGGESSGHIIFSDVNSTGDGLLAALKLLSLIVEEKKPLSELQLVMTLYPQKTGAITVLEKKPLQSLPAIQSTLNHLRDEMGETGRVLLRYSGTENKIRLLVEGENAESVYDWYQILESQVRAQLT